MVDNVTLTSLKKHIQTDLLNYFSNRNMLVLNYKIESKKFKNNSFVSNLHQIFLKYKIKGNEHKYCIFVKDVKCPENPKKESHPISYFKSELFMYETVFPIFDDTQNSVITEMKFNHAKYLLGSTAIFKEFLILEDLNSRGYATESRDRFLDINHMRMALTQLARFHGCSLVYKHSYHEDYLKLTKHLNERLIVSQEWFESLLRRSYHKSKGILAQSVQVEMDNLWTDFLPTVYQLVKSEEAESYAVIGHGDLWTGNILFKHNKVGDIVDCVLVDWQLVRHHSPVIDLLHLLFTSTAEGIRREDLFIELIEHYHTALRQYLHCLNMDVDSLLPLNAIWKHLKKFARVGMAIGLVALPLHARSSDDVIDVEEMLSGRDLLEFNCVSAHNFRSMIVYMCDILSFISN